MSDGVISVERVLDYVGQHPGQITSEIATGLGTTVKNLSTRLSKILSKNETLGERLKRVQVVLDPKRPQNATFRWYLPQDFPQGEQIPLPQEALELIQAEPETTSEVLESIPAETQTETETVVEAEPQSAEPSSLQTTTVHKLLSYISEHPGSLSEEVAAGVGLDPTDVASRLFSVFKSKGKRRLDRVEIRRESGKKGYRWYLSEDMPQEELDRRAAEAEALRQQAEAERIARKEAAQKAKEEQLAEAARIREAEEAEARRLAEEQQAEAARLAEEARQAEEAQAEVVAVQATMTQFPGLMLPQPPGEIIQQAMSECIGKIIEVIIPVFQTQLDAAIALSIERAFQSAPARVTPALPGAAKPTAQPAKVKNKRPKVMVVGLKPELTHFIRDEFPQLDLDFFPNDCNPAALRDKLVYIDNCFLMTDKISHKHKDIVVKSRCDFTYVSGGLTSLKDNLRALIALACTA